LVRLARRERDDERVGLDGNDGRGNPDFLLFAGGLEL
jgi:hypothetical protein